MYKTKKGRILIKNNDVFDLEEVIDIIERLIHATEDDVSQYGGNPSEDEDVIDGKKLLTALKNCR